MMSTRYGPAYTNGSSFRARAEARQRQFRVEHLVDANWERWGHVLDRRSADAGANFLTKAAHDAALRREKRGKGVAHDRTFANMLSSQAMCFNLFGPLAAPDGLPVLAAVLADLGMPVHSVHSIEIEYTPRHAVFLDQSGTGGVDCDVLLRISSSDGRDGILVIETKFVERDFSRCGFRRKPSPRINRQTGLRKPADRCPEGTSPRADGTGCRYQTKRGYLYWKHTTEMATIRSEVFTGPCPFGGFFWQLWTNHTLAHALRDSLDDLAILAVCAPPGNSELLATRDDPVGKINDFQRLVTEPGTVKFLSTDDLISRLRAHVPKRFPERTAWLDGLEARYGGI